MNRTLGQHSILSDPAGHPYSAKHTSRFVGNTRRSAVSWRSTESEQAVARRDSVFLDLSVLTVYWQIRVTSMTNFGGVAIQITAKQVSSGIVLSNSLAP